MSPIRLIIIGILLYIGYLLIKGGSSNTKKKEDGEEIDDSAKISDVLVEDPVCKKLVPKGQAVTAEYEGNTNYFCSKECCDIFVSEKGAEQ